MKFCKYVFLLLTLMTMLCSCTQNEEGTDIYTKIYEKYKNLQTYSCKITMTVRSNKSTNHYKMQQYYKAPNVYRTEILEPEKIKGLITIYRDHSVTTIQPNVGGKITLTDSILINESSYMFLPDFFKTYYKSEQTSVAASNMEGARYTILKTDIPGNNIYRFSQSLWIDHETLLPFKMEVYDIKNKPVISIQYEEVKLDAEIDDAIFEID